MSWVDDLLGKTVQQNGTSVVDRKILNFKSGATVTDNPSTGATDVEITGGGSGGAPFAGHNPNSGGDSPQNGIRGDLLRNTGVWNGFAFWSCITAGSPGIWVPTGRGGNTIGTSISYQALSTDKAVRVTNTSSVRTITLPDVTTIAPFDFDLKVTDASFAATGNNTIVVGHASETIGNASSFSVIADGQGNSFTFTWNGSTWDIS